MLDVVEMPRFVGMAETDTCSTIEFGAFVNGRKQTMIHEIFVGLSLNNFSKNPDVSQNGRLVHWGIVL